MALEVILQVSSPMRSILIALIAALCALSVAAAEQDRSPKEMVLLTVSGTSVDVQGTINSDGSAVAEGIAIGAGATVSATGIGGAVTMTGTANAPAASGSITSCRSPRMKFSEEGRSWCA